MHGTIYQISTEPVDLNDYISEDTVSVGDMAGFDYLYDTEKEERQERIQNLVENVFPKGMFTIAPGGEAIVYQGGFTTWRKSYLELLRAKTADINEDNIMEWIGPSYQLQKAIVNPLGCCSYFVTEASGGYGTAERSRDLMLMVGKLETGAKLYIGAILGYHD